MILAKVEIFKSPPQTIFLFLSPFGESTRRGIEVGDLGGFFYAKHLSRFCRIGQNISVDKGLYLPAF